MRSPKDREYTLLWVLALLVFVFMFMFLITSAACKANMEAAQHPGNGWIARGSAVPWIDPPRSRCFWMA